MLSDYLKNSTNDMTYFFICMVFAIALGFLQAFVYTVKNRYTKSFVTTLILLPVAVCMIVLLVNNNIGVAVAVAGAFTLVRFRSVPGTGKEITAIFISMVTGVTLASWQTYNLEYALFFSLIGSGLLLILNTTNLFTKTNKKEMILKVTVPEMLNYYTVFEDVFNKYTVSCEKLAVKSVNMGSMFKLTYRVVLKDIELEKEFIDELRIRNGNLEISLFDDSYNENML
ncbi:MAG: DUF4956 domain-containing protein [Erysipelotrichaceae bacterium]|nr:DUF4956 domain-containing protein [Erysipelotrichaceae bacterium]